MKFQMMETQLAMDTAIRQIDQKDKLIIIGQADQLESLQEELDESEDSVEDIIAKSKDINPQTWFAEREAEFAEYENEFDADELDDDELEYSEFAEAAGEEWPEIAPQPQGMVSTRDFATGELYPQVQCVNVETNSTWEIPAHFKYGGWNDCPNPEVQCAIWRYWEEKYGAKIIAVTSDIIEAYVANPPQTQEESLALAKEQYFYCTDIVDQGVQSVTNLGATLLNNKFWFFWWD